MRITYVEHVIVSVVAHFEALVAAVCAEAVRVARAANTWPSALRIAATTQQTLRKAQRTLQIGAKVFCAALLHELELRRDRLEAGFLAPHSVAAGVGIVDALRGRDKRLRHNA